MQVILLFMCIMFTANANCQHDWQVTFGWLLLYQVQFKMVSIHLKRPISWFPQHCLEAVPMFIWLIHCHPFKVDCQALPPQLQVVSRAPWNLWFSEMQATTCNGCFAHQSVCSVISLDSSFSRAALSTVVSKSGFQNGDTCQSGLPIALFVPSS